MIRFLTATVFGYIWKKSHMYLFKYNVFLNDEKTKTFVRALPCGTVLGHVVSGVANICLI